MSAFKLAFADGRRVAVDVNGPAVTLAVTGFGSQATVSFTPDEWRLIAAGLGASAPEPAVAVPIT